MPEDANLIQQVLRVIGDHPSRCSCCEVNMSQLNQVTALRRLLEPISTMISSMAGQSQLATNQQRYTPPSAASATTSSSSQNNAQSIPLSSSIVNYGITQTSGSGPWINSTVQQQAAFWVVFGVRNYDFDKIENIETSSLLNDPEFFPELKAKHSKHVWFFRRWFSPFRFRYCQFVQVCNTPDTQLGRALMSG